MVVKITQIAKSKMVELLKNHKTKCLLFSVKGGGCNGFNYHFEPTKKLTTLKTEVVPIDDDHSLIICNKSIFHLFGVTIDYKNNIMGSGFEFSNPNASGSCGCGKSFN